MEYPISRVIVQRICDERNELVPYLARIIDSMERHGGLYSTKLADVVPADVIEELEEWLEDHRRTADREPEAGRPKPQGLNVVLPLLERIFPESGSPSV